MALHVISREWNESVVQLQESVKIIFNEPEDRVRS
jgi:hypothetical protein